MKGQVVGTVSYKDPTVVLLSRHHLPVVVLSVTILIFVLSPPTILLMLYPSRCFQKATAHLNTRWQLRLKIFTDKDVTNTSRDYRPVSGFIFVIWIIFPAVNGIVTLAGKRIIPWLVTFIPLLITLALACVVFEPYKKRSANTSGTVLLVTLSVAVSTSAILDIYSFLNDASLGAGRCSHIATLCSLWILYTQACQESQTTRFHRSYRQQRATNKLILHRRH